MSAAGYKARSAKTANTACANVSAMVTAVRHPQKSWYKDDGSPVQKDVDIVGLAADFARLLMKVTL